MRIPAQRIRIPKTDRGWIQERIDEILYETGWMAYGPYVEQFEKEFARYVGTKYAVATGSGTQALEIGMRALGETMRKEPSGVVVLPTNTYMASLYSIQHAGFHESLCDIQSDGNTSLRMIAAHMGVDKGVPEGLHGHHVVGIMVVHIGGNVVQDIEAIRDYCEDKGFFLIEDCAHAHGSVLNGQKAGTFGDVGCFSFYPTKIMTVGGEGGILVTDNEDVYEYARRYRHCGRDPPGTGVHAYHIMPGHNYCMDEIRAIIGLSQLRRLDEYIARRREIADRYCEKFNLLEYAGSNCYKIITMNQLRVHRKFSYIGPTPSKIKIDLSADDVIHFPGKVFEVPCHLQPIISMPGMYPNAEKYCKLHSCLPVYNDMTMEEVEYVIENVEVVK